MSLRASIEAILKKHCDLHDAKDDCYLPIDWTELLDDLLATLPHPSQEGLKKIFIRHNHQYDSREDWLSAIQDSIMAWANGQREAACDHRGLIRYESDHGIVSKIRTDLKKLFGECPLCTAPRPEDA